LSSFAGFDAYLLCYVALGSGFFYAAFGGSKPIINGSGYALSLLLIFFSISETIF